MQASLLGELLRGELQPGSRLRQDELADRLGVSKIPVREALQRLVGLGLARFETNRGAVVVELSSAGAEENYALRRGIEPQLLERAMGRHTIVDLAEAEMALAADGMAPTEANWAFHRALYRPSGWERGLAMVEILHVAVAPYVALYTQQLGGAGDSAAEHRALLDACRRGEVEPATLLLLAHLDRACQVLVAHLASTGW